MRIFVHRHLTFMQDTEHLCLEHQHRVVDSCHAHRFLALEMVHPRHSFFDLRQQRRRVRDGIRCRGLNREHLTVHSSFRLASVNARCSGQRPSFATANRAFHLAVKQMPAFSLSRAKDELTGVLSRGVFPSSLAPYWTIECSKCVVREA